MRRIQVRWASLSGVLCWLLVATVHLAVADNIGVAGSEQDVAYYVEALTELGFETQMVSAEALADVEQLAPLTHLVVANADELSVAQQHAIRDYVEAGGLLVGTELTSKSLPLLLGVEYRVGPQYLRAFYAPKTRSRRIPISLGFPQGKWIEPRANRNAYDCRVCTGVRAINGVALAWVDLWERYPYNFDSKTAPYPTYSIGTYDFIVVNRYGEGATIFVAAPLAKVYLSHGEPHYAEILRAVFDPQTRQKLLGVNDHTFKAVRNFVVKREELGADTWKRLPKAHFEWKAIQLASHVGSKEEIEQTVTNIHRMGFNVILFTGAIHRGYVAWDSDKFEKDPALKDIDVLAVLARKAHARGIKVYAGGGLWAGVLALDGKGNATDGPEFFRQHPEYACVTPAQHEAGLTWQQLEGRVYLCPEQPEVRRYFIEAYAEAIEKYELDGAWLDMIRYPTVDVSCECDYSRQQRAVFAKEHPEYKSEEEIVYRHCEQSIVSFVEELRRAIKAVNPEAELAAYTWPSYANKYPLDWHSRRCSHRHAPQWTLERLVKGAEYLVSPGYAKTFHEYTEGAPMIDVGWKDADETRNEIRLVGASGAKGIFIYYYHYFAIYPEEKMQVTAEELGGQWEQ